MGSPFVFYKQVYRKGERKVMMKFLAFRIIQERIFKEQEKNLKVVHILI